MSNPRTLGSKKAAPPPVRVTYSLKTASGNSLKTQSGDQITVKY